MSGYSGMRFAADVNSPPRRRDLTLNGRSRTARRSAQFCRATADPTPKEAEALLRQDRPDDVGSRIANGSAYFGLQNGELVFDPKQTPSRDRTVPVGVRADGARAWVFD